MLTKATCNLPEVVVRRAQKYAEDNGTTLTALIRERLDELADVKHDSLIEFFHGRITKEQAIESLGMRDYAQLLVALGDSDLPMPTIPNAQIEQQVETFSRLWSSP